MFACRTSCLTNDLLDIPTFNADRSMPDLTELISLFKLEMRETIDILSVITGFIPIQCEEAYEISSSIIFVTCGYIG
ncbi:MAG: hypothetical protein IMZ52_09970, partial [Actinobacteria bacterium]|nr:hypothetical protein [Actinomycetota bacterium]